MTIKFSARGRSSFGREFSAGGIVIRKKNEILNPIRQAQGLSEVERQVQDDIEILLCQHSQHHGWVFPKGLIGDNIENESKEATALREVKEETGVVAKIIHPLSPVTYWYVFEGEKIRKTVYYFLMEYVSGDIKNHDFEMENVEWLSVEEIEERLTYPSDKKVWKEAKKLIANF